jgi:hypothetical protein
VNDQPITESQGDLILQAVQTNTATIAKAMEVVAEERKGRKLSVRLMGVALVLVLMVGAGWVANNRAESASKRKLDCANRVISRQEVRNYGEALVDEVSQPPLVRLTDEQKRDLISRVVEVGLEELPARPPGC